MVCVFQPLAVGLDTQLKYVERNRSGVLNIKIAVLGESPDVNLDLGREAVELSEDCERVDEQVHSGLELEIDDVLDQLVSEVVTVFLDLLETIGLC